MRDDFDPLTTLIAVADRLSGEELRLARQLSRLDADGFEKLDAAMTEESDTADARASRYERARTVVKTAMGVGLVVALLVIMLACNDAIGDVPGWSIIGGWLGLGLLWLADGALDARAWDARQRGTTVRGYLAPPMPWQRANLRVCEKVSPRAAFWSAHVTDVLHRPFTAVDQAVMGALAAEEWADSASTARQTLSLYRAEPHARPYSEAELLGRLDAASAHPLKPTRDEAQLMLSATDADLDRERDELEKLLANHRPCAERIERLWARLPLLGRFTYALVPGLLWRPLTSAPMPGVLQVVDGVGLVAFVGCLAVAAYCIHGWSTVPEQLAEARYRLRSLQPLNMYESDMMEDFLAESALARAWHHQVVAVQNRQLRQQDLWAVMTLTQSGDVRQPG